ncbi:serine hydrolase domain-containing protein [Mycobacterium sp.]|uniref:serine hydrolase domain-containing protein n=1 Tax=Mycobacterium sp. TaxID=1785 RepID=UPI002BFE81CC|nr:serine hydrolase domain-containing protein [Mycobacterium sp.]HTY30782.1 serine hydrolase domain-containing protein [Mycobacterium sp.]
MTQPTVNFTNFINSVRNNLKGFVVGYAGAIGSATAAAATSIGGEAVTPANGQAGSFTTATQSQTASVSKFLTAIAAVQLLDPPHPGAADAGQNYLGADLDTPISHGGLPKDWNLRADAQHITYRDVLTHRSGIAPEGSANEPGQDYFSLKAYMTQETVKLQPPPAGQTAYSNVGFALFRLMLPKLAGLVTDTMSVPEEDRARGYAAAYERIIREKVFGAVNVLGPKTETPSTGHAFAYYYPGTASGYDWSHWQYSGQVWPGQGMPLWAGAGGWWVSIDQFIPVLDSINRGDGKILSDAQWLHMQGLDAPAGYQNLGLGIDLVVDPANGNYRWVEKNGGAGGGDSTGSGTVSGSVAFFGALQGTASPPAPAYYAALLINSDVSAGPGSQSNWWSCSKCYTLATGKNAGVCPATGSAKKPHTAWGQYVLSSAAKGLLEQGDWRACSKCAALCYEPSSSDPSKCPADGGKHACTGEAFTLYAQSQPYVGKWASYLQHDWRWCKNCGVLAYSGGSASVGVCPHGGPHEFVLSGDNYTLQEAIGADAVLLQAFHDAIV